MKIKLPLINIVYILVFITIFFYIKEYVSDLNTNVKELKHNIELREAQNDSIARKLDSIAVKKVEVINNIDKRSTTINNLQESLTIIPTYDTSLANAIIFLRAFSNKQLN
jgi:uncharacterized protein YoxC